ncbi:peroxisomal membrane protein PEX16 isoform X2 [Zootermopsis nevadensis]|uniref:peroxisomal membrane protein PEX16 isoform X2 n=1 Tax=Zootermopsis nevadensis TaxID=136037 RepID=UPI000B8E4B95|nr:peroxisomal membrane protein PEX16 isoform X2 [Zootermopsis nevadensis]
MYGVMGSVVTDYQYLKFGGNTGRINTSNVLSELVYCLSNLLVLFNDRIIHNARRLQAVGSGEKLKTWLTVIDYSEVFIEVSARRMWGEKGKWLIVIVLQIFKCAGRLLLLFYHKDNIIQSPSMPPLRRKKAREDSHVEESRIRLQSAAFTLKRSGRIVRRVTAAPPTSCRTWRPLLPPNNNAEEDGVPDQTLSGKMLIAEVLYVVKPVAHLCSMMLFGQKDWKPWLLALSADLASLQLYGTKHKERHMSRKQRLELSRRTISLLLYLLRSPFYERHSSDRLQAVLRDMSANVPLARVLCNPIAQYIPQWQDTYFYMWST